MKLLIVDDHPLVRKGISSIFSFEGNVAVVLEASNINEAMTLIGSEVPELSIVDLNLGKEDGLELVMRARSEGAKTKFVILTSSVRKEDFIRSEEVGIDGYILKEAFAEDILYAINLVMRGKKFIDSEILRYQAENNTKDDYLNDLTPREEDVLRELGKGLSNMEIAENLFISENTVKKHVSNILLKLNFNHRTEAALFANQNMANGY
ncbi:MAG TPA: response regulator transcription factor [Clostridia bacterium]|nr:response regulator transcription factor [Clostridia bacterium]